MNSALYMVAIVSFMLGSFGYVTAKFIVIPIGRYRRLRARTARLLVQYREKIATDKDKGHPLSKDGDFKKRMRQLSADLADCWTEQLPHWYKLYIEGRRPESPLDAATGLMTLANTRNREHAARQIESIKAHLKLK